MPANCTDRLQPMDLSINKPAKNFLKQQFQLWYSNEIYLQKERSGKLEPIPFPMITMKPLGAKWLIEFYNYMLVHPEMVQNGFKAAGVTCKDSKS